MSETIEKSVTIILDIYVNFVLHASLICYSFNLSSNIYFLVNKCVTKIVIRFYKMFYLKIY